MKTMISKTLNRTAILLIGACATLLSSCKSDDSGTVVRIYSALVTVKPNADNSQFYLQLDDSTTLMPVNVKSSPFGKKEVRALTNFTRSDQNPGQYSQAVFLNWIDSILTKPLAKNYTIEENKKKKYGSDSLEIVNNWVNIAEDGYLTLRFRTVWGGSATHTVNLVYRKDAEKPYTLTFYHNAHGDKKGIIGDGLVAFKLDSLPDTKGSTVDLTLEWMSYTGAKSTTFKYCTRKATNTIQSDAIERMEKRNME